ncbi:MAG: MFS transporter [Firmicutes bacterium HGW-Firmicutes-1]|jgi:MFS family permease|nr:MAG: MFS transporter [Firmicutes bacterium HGW-Firmicutes-1]
MNFFKNYSGLPKTVYVLFIAQVINRFGDFVMPFLTLFLTRHLGMSNKSAGAAVMLTILASIPGAFAGGKIADHYGRKKTHMIFQGLAGVAIFLCTFTRSPWVIILLLAISAFFNGGVRPIMTAIMTDVLEPDQRKLGFSLTYLGINIGVALGPLVAGFLFNEYLYMIFIGDAITTVIAVTLVGFYIKETLPSHLATESDLDRVIENAPLEEVESGTIISVLARRPQVVLFLVFNTFYSATYTQLLFSLPIMMNHVFGDSGPTFFGTLMTINAITVLAFTMIIAHFTHKWRPITGVVLGGIAYFIGFGMISFSRILPLFWISTFIWTIGEILVVTNFGVYISNNTPQNFRARISAVTSLSWAIGSMLGTYCIGIYMDATSVEAVWPFVSVIVMIGVLGMMGIRWYDSRPTKEHSRIATIYCDEIEE